MWEQLHTDEEREREREKVLGRKEYSWEQVHRSGGSILISISIYYLVVASIPHVENPIPRPSLEKL